MTTEPDELDRKIAGYDKCNGIEEYRAWQASFTPEENAEYARRAKKYRQENGIPEPVVTQSTVSGVNSIKRLIVWVLIAILGLAGVCWLEWKIAVLLTMDIDTGKFSPVILDGPYSRPGNINDTIQSFVMMMTLMSVIFFGWLVWALSDEGLLPKLNPWPSIHREPQWIALICMLSFASIYYRIDKTNDQMHSRQQHEIAQVMHITDEGEIASLKHDNDFVFYFFVGTSFILMHIANAFGKSSENPVSAALTGVALFTCASFEATAVAVATPLAAVVIVPVVAYMMFRAGVGVAYGKLMN